MGGWKHARYLCVCDILTRENLLDVFLLEPFFRCSLFVLWGFHVSGFRCYPKYTVTPTTLHEKEPCRKGHTFGECISTNDKNVNTKHNFVTTKHKRPTSWCHSCLSLVYNFLGTIYLHASVTSECHFSKKIYNFLN